MSNVQGPSLGKTARPVKGATSQRGRPAEVTRDAWIEVGLQELGKHGPAALRIDRLCRRLKITKGSFYWHFSSRDAFVRAVLDKWFESGTLALIERVDKAGGKPEEKLRRLVEEANAGTAVDFRLEQVTRHWAAADRNLREHIVEVDSKRLDYTTVLLMECGYSRGEAIARSHLLYSLMVGEAMIFRREPAATRAERIERCLGLILAPSDGCGRTTSTP